MFKQIIIVRSDLEMGRGKIAAQTSHASVLAYERVKCVNPAAAKSWFEEGMKKVVLKVGSEEELLDYFKKGKAAGIPCELVRDAGHTQIAPGSITCFGAGPADEKTLDELFGKLKLL